MNWLVVLLAAGAAYALAGPQVLEQIRKAAGLVNLPQLERRHMIGAALLAAAAIAWQSSSSSAPQPTPAPGPAPDAELVLRGTFVGPDASVDAATISAMFDELAAEVEWDAMQVEPLIRTGVAFDDLRVRAFDLRLRGQSLGERYPRARSAIKDYLDRTAGTSGGPLTPAQRSAWVSAYRTVARAAADATR
jgi:hypothetical protein